MIDYPSFTLSGDGEWVKVSVCWYEFPAKQTGEDANWLIVEVRFDLDGFKGKYQGYYEATDLARFLKELESAVSKLQGKAVLSGIEPTAEITVSMEARGTAVIEGELIRTPGSGPWLSFQIETDQSYLQETVRQLREVVERFPIRE